MPNWLRRMLRRRRDPPPFGMDVALKGLRGRGVQPDIIFDIGASDGSWTKQALAIWPQARFHCFEPLAARRTAMQRLVAERPGQITHHSIGVSDADGELSLGVAEGLWASSFAYKGVSEQSVPVRSLDSLLQTGEIVAPNFIKIDVQGFERRVIAGGAATIAHCDFILMECAFYPFCAEMQRLDESIGFMAAAGFAPYEFVDFLRRPADGAMGQCDILFIRRTHPLMADTRWNA